MTERQSEISDRIEGVRQLGAVVGAMTSIAGARARTARAQIAAVDRYAATIAAAMRRAGAGPPRDHPPRTSTDSGRPVSPALVVFCAEQGFVGAFSERVLDSVGADLATADIFLIGTRGGAIATARGIVPVWQAALPAHSASIPKFADALAQVVLRHVAAGRFSALESIHTDWRSGRPRVDRRVLFPVDIAGPPDGVDATPLTNLPPPLLLAALEGDHLHAQLCNATLHAFAAENEARMAAMTKAETQISRELALLEATARRVRQEAITAEIIEIATGEMASRRKQLRP